MGAWRIRHESVSHDLLNGEVIAIHLGTGVYYSLRGTAAAIWQMLATPASASAIAEALAAAFVVDRVAAEAAAAGFLQQLRDEDLVVEDASMNALVMPSPAERQPFAAPAIERFADLQDLLLLDPIHDVGTQGWPHQATKPS